VRFVAGRKKLLNKGTRLRRRGLVRNNGPCLARCYDIAVLLEDAVEIQERYNWKTGLLVTIAVVKAPKSR
jgi:hypothetical protein